MFSLSTIVIAVCDVIIVVCFVLFALRYRKLVERVSTMRDNLDFCHHSLVNYMIDLNEIRSSIAFNKREIDSLRSDVRKLGDCSSSLLTRFCLLETSQAALSSRLEVLNKFCDSLLTCIEVKSVSTNKTTKKSVKNGKK